jgi:hypothetical protein
VSSFAPAGFDEFVQRLILGVEPLDAQRGTRIAQPIAVRLDGVPYLDGSLPIVDFDGSLDPLGYLPTVQRHNSCRHALVYPPDMKGPIAIRLFDDARRFVPRRISYPVPTDATVLPPPVRVRRPALFPGAAYDVSPTATGMRGRVTWKSSTANEQAARWVRVAAVINGQIVGRAHGDDRGEFLLLLDNEAGGPGDLPSPLVAQVTVYGPPAPPAVAVNDPLSDLPVELLAADPDVVSAGETLPTGYAATPSSTRAVTFELGTLLTNQPKFFFQV